MSEFKSSVTSPTSEHKQAREVVEEYLKYMSCDKTVAEFKREARRKSSHLSESMGEVQARLIGLMNGGQREEFFEEWDSTFAGVEDESKDKMRFYVEIFFATYSYRGSADFDPEDNLVRLAGFRQFLETEGADLSQSHDFFPYCALVCIKNPTTHRAFRNIFSVEWEKSLSGKLKKFTRKFYGKGMPRLLTLLSKSSEGLEKKLEEASRQRDEADLKLEEAAKQLSFLENDYRNLIDIAGELINVLEDAVNGKSLTPEHLDDIAKRMFQNPSVGRLISGRVKATERVKVTERAKAPLISPRPGKMPKLNFEKVRQKIAEMDEVETPLLLQAIRWRLTTAEKQMRGDVLLSLVSNDVLGCSQQEQGGVEKCLSSTSRPLRQYMARLINSMASLARGRDYLTLCPSLLGCMVSAMMKEPGDTTTRQHLIGAIQKLTLRRSFQTEMIRMDLIQWTMTQLESELSDYSLEYGVALVMNLCLLRAGRKVCVPNAAKYLRLLLRLLDAENVEIQPYVHGTMYTLLSEPQIRELALEMDMEAQLGKVVNSSGPEEATQIQHILRRLQDEVESPRSDEEEESDNSEDDPDVMEPDLNENEIVQASPCGEQLLREKYSSTAKLGPDFYMSRPQTPLRKSPNRAPSRVRQSKPLLPPEKIQDTDPEPPAKLENKPQIKNQNDIFAARPRLARTPDAETGRQV